MKIVILDGYTENPGDLSWAGIEALGSLTVYDRTAEGEIVPRIGDAQAVLVNKVPLTAATLAACPGLKYIGVLATGYNVVDTAAAKQRGIVVTNIPSYGTRAVAQFVFALLLEICHHVGAHSRAVHMGQWAQSLDFSFWNYPLTELAGKTLGLVGFGRIGQSTAHIARAFGMRVLYHTPRPKQGVEELAAYATLNELLEKSDVISLHCPLTPETKGMINSASIAKMKRGVILINTARGPLIEEADLAAALNSGRVYAAGLDVVSEEPIKPDNPLLAAKNCFITPHIAWAPLESRARLMETAVQNLRAFVNCKPQNVVNG